MPMKKKVQLPPTDWAAGIAALRDIVRMVAPLRGRQWREALNRIRGLALWAAGDAEIEAFIRQVESPFRRTKP